MPATTSPSSWSRFRPTAYAELDKTVTADALKRQGVTLEAREAVPLSTGKAFLVIGRQEVEKRQDSQMDSGGLLAGSDRARHRADPGRRQDRLSRRRDPRRAGDARRPHRRSGRGAARPVAVQGRRACGISDRRGRPGTRGHAERCAARTRRDRSTPRLEPHIFVTVAPGGPAQNAERDAFARDVFATIPNLKEIRVTTSETVADGRPAGPPDPRQCPGRHERPPR